MEKRYLKTLSLLPGTMTDRVIKAYYPLPHFPPLSFSNTCNLSCLHCQGQYLKSMKKCTTPQELYCFAQELSHQAGTGFLASGGFTPTGTLLNLNTMIPSLARIKKTTSLVVALHTGFVTRHMAQKIQQTGIDVVCPHVMGDEDAIQEIMGLSATPQDFSQTLRTLHEAQIAVSPHICAGIYWGRLQGEKEALVHIKESCQPETVVLTTLCPTRNTPMKSSSVLSPVHLADIIKQACDLFPQVDISLGCMRPRQRSLEIHALHAGITRIANPSKSFLTYAKKKGYRIKTYAACCGVPSTCEQHTETTAV